MLQSLTSLSVAQPDRFKMHIFVDSLDGPENTSLFNNKLRVGRIDKSAIERCLGLGTSVPQWHKIFKASHIHNMSKRDQKILFLVCGPDQ